MLPATGLRTHAWNTAIRSVLLLAGFPLLLTMMGYAIALFIVSGQARTVEEGLVEAARLLPVIVPAALALALVWFAIAFLAHNRILDAITGAKRVTDPRQEPRFWKLTEELCISRGMTLPRLAVIETPQRNAFASGLTRETAGVTVTRGLMDALDDRELRAVIAHELAHIRNGDARLGVIAAVFVGVITLVTDRVWNILRFARFRTGSGTGGGRSSRSSSSSSSSSRGNGGGGAMLALILIGIVIAVLAHVLALVLRMALSRNREYLADAGAVEMTGDADAMIGALRKVEQRAAMPAIPEQVRALFLHDAALSGAAGWFATHPPIGKRVETLVRFAGGHDPGPLPALAEETAEAAPLPWSEEAPAGASGFAGGPWSGSAGTAASAPILAAPRSPMQERLDAMAAFARTGNALYMDNLHKRTAARRAGRDPDEAAPAPPRRDAPAAAPMPANPGSAAQPAASPWGPRP